MKPTEFKVIVKCILLWLGSFEHIISRHYESVAVYQSSYVGVFQQCYVAVKRCNVSYYFDTVSVSSPKLDV